MTRPGLYLGLLIGPAAMIAAVRGVLARHGVGGGNDGTS